MAHYSCSVRSPKTPDEAFAYMADFRNLVEWDPGVSSSTLADGDEPGMGAAYRVAASGAMLTYRTIEFDPPKRMVVEADNRRLRSYDVIEVVEHGDGSLVTYDATLTMKGLFAPANLILGLFFRRIGDKAAAGMERALDGTLVGR